MLFADEPTAALDSARGREVIQLFQLLARNHGMSVCVVTHDPRWIEHFDTVLEMSDGRIVRLYKPRLDGGPGGLQGSGSGGASPHGR